MCGLAELFKAELGVAARVAENAETAVAEGMRRYLFLEKAKRGSVLNEYFAKTSVQSPLIEAADAAMEA